MQIRTITTGAREADIERAAQAAQMRCVIVPCDLTRHLSFPGAWKQYRSLKDVTVPELL